MAFEQQGEWDLLYAPLLATLAAAQEMASLETLARWTGLEADYRLKQLLWEEWAPFLFRSDDRFRLYHASLRDFLSGEMTAEDLIPADKALVTEMAERTRGSHRRIATCYLTDSTRWADHNGYALRHLSRHLAQAGMFAELGNLIENRAWYEVQRNYDPSLDAYAADVVQSAGTSRTPRYGRPATGRGLEPAVRHCSHAVNCAGTDS